MHKSALIRIANLSVFLFVMLLFFVFEREELLINMLSDIDNYGSSLLNISLFALTLTLSACSLYGRWSGNKLFLCFGLRFNNLWAFSIKQYVWHLQTADLVPVFRLFSSRE